MKLLRTSVALMLAAALGAACIANPTPHPIEDKTNIEPGADALGTGGGGGGTDTGQASADAGPPPSADRDACEADGGFWQADGLFCDFGVGGPADAAAEPDGVMADSVSGGDAGPLPDAAPTVEERVVTSSGGVELPVRIVGDPAAGEVLVLLHGGPALSAGYMRSLEALATPTRAVVTYEQRGAGAATMPVDGDYGIDAHLADLEAVRADLGVAQVHLLGHSWGGRVAMAYAVAHPDRVTSLLLLGGAPPTSVEATAGGVRFQTRLGQLQLTGDVPLVLPVDPDEAFQAILPVYFHDPAFVAPAELTTVTTNLAAQTATQGQAMALYDVTEDLGALTLPVLVAFGASDPFGTEWQAATVAALTQAEVTSVTFAACGHFWVECPTPLFEAVEGFLAGADQP